MRMPIRFLIVLAGACLVAGSAAAEPTKAQVKVDRLEIRLSKGTVATVVKGDELSIISRKGPWAGVQYEKDGKRVTGWVPLSSLVETSPTRVVPPETPAVGALNTGIGEGSTTAYVCVRKATVRPRPAHGDGETGGDPTVPLGTAVGVKEIGAEWVKVAVGGMAGDRWIHRSLLCGDKRVVDLMAKNGPVPGAVMVYVPSDDEEGTARLLGGDMAATLAKDKKTVIMHPKPGDCIWFTPDAPPVKKKECPLKSFGIPDTLQSPEPYQHYAFDGFGHVVSLASLLTEATRSTAATLPNILCVSCPAQACPAPRDIFWSSGMGFVVADAEKGVLFLEASPVDGVNQVDAIERPGQGARLVGLHSKGFFTAWTGARNEVVQYGPKKGDELTVVSTVELPDEPTAFLSLGGKVPIALVGTRTGRLLAVDTEAGEVVSDVTLCKQAVRQLLSGEKEQAWAACGSEGVVELDTSDPKQPKVKSRPVAMGHANTLATTWQNKKAHLMVGRHDGLYLYDVSGSTPEMKGLVGGAEDEAVVGVARGAVGGASMNMTVNDAPVIVLVGKGAGGLSICAGRDLDQLKLSHSVRVPTGRMAWGSQFLACASDERLCFVSLSEVLPADCGGVGLGIHGGAEVAFEGGGLKIVRAEAHGVILVDKVSNLARAESWRSNRTSDKQVTVVERDDGFVIMGDMAMLNGAAVVFRPGLQIAVGKGGATLAGKRYEAGRVLTLDESGTPTVAGQWRGYPM